MMAATMLDAETSLKRDLGLRDDEDLPEPEYMPPRDEEVWEPPRFGVFLKEHMDQFVEMYKQGRQPLQFNEVASHRSVHSVEETVKNHQDDENNEIRFSRKFLVCFSR